MPATPNPVTKVFRKRVTEGQSKMARLKKLVCNDAYERALRSQGYRTIAGVDEVGRGCLFGPVVAAAVILPEDVRRLRRLGLRDSKQLPEERRRELDLEVRAMAIAVCVAEVDAVTIDAVNIYQASRLAMLRAVEGLALPPDLLLDHLLIDAMRLDHACAQTKLIYGDSLSLSIAAASVVAKVYRDALMVACDAQWPQYGFASHKGYATARHRKALMEHGVHEQHRRSFAPVAAVLAGMAIAEFDDKLAEFDDKLAEFDDKLAEFDDKIGEDIWDED